MKLKLHCIPILILASVCSFGALGQINIDSLQKTILKSLQQKFDKEGAPRSFFDTSKIFSGKNPVNLGQIFKEVNKTLATAKLMGDTGKLRSGYYSLSKLDSMRGNYRGAYENYKLYTLYRDSLQKKETEKKELQAKMQYEFDKKQAIAKAEQGKKDAEQKRIKNLQYFTIAGLTALVLGILIIAVIQWKNNNQKKKANTLLQLQKEKVESTLSDLRSTQAQLIQSEKMASLGELTAGIAHEIQNPLNFVNNFSEVNNELIEELRIQNSKFKIENSEQEEILKDIFNNNEKISFHGKRADAIVKGMLQHSRQTSSTKEPTDINALADEYLRLAYHGLRAKDNSFNATIKTDFDNTIEKINIVPQDIGRVILNLLTNAFYAVTERQKAESLKLNAESKYEPTVIVSTKRSLSPDNTQDGEGRGEVLITVKDNGNGIPQKIFDKIFQPFFTTKPTGQGTGLGLSLSYDIVKAHGGEIKVESEQGKGTEFIIQLPVA